MTNRADLLSRLAEAFPDAAISVADARVVRAPGRVNLIGEHTDYNDGLVLPVAISLETLIAFVPTYDDSVELVSGAERARLSLASIGPPRGAWMDYVAGVARELQASGRSVGGLRGVVSSTLPVSAGLSSSAALELAAAWALLSVGPGVERQAIPACLELALICQRAENEFLGVASGLMDQFSSACGVAGAALLLDCRSLEHRTVSIPDDVALVVVDTGSRRRLTTSDYNLRRFECRRGVQILARRDPPVQSLRDATLAMLEDAKAELGSTIYNRCRHVVEENARVNAAVLALEGNDYPTMQELFAASHASLRDLYEVSSIELDTAVAIAARTPGVIAARMTGAGFGGCTVNIVERGRVSALKEAIESSYRPRSGARATVWEVTAAPGAGMLLTDDQERAGLV